MQNVKPIGDIKCHGVTAPKHTSPMQISATFVMIQMGGQPHYFFITDLVRNEKGEIVQINGCDTLRGGTASFVLPHPIKALPPFVARTHFDILNLIRDKINQHNAK